MKSDFKPPAKFARSATFSPYFISNNPGLLNPEPALTKFLTILIYIESPDLNEVLNDVSPKIKAL